MRQWGVAVVLGLVHSLSFYQGHWPSAVYSLIQLLSFALLFGLVLRSRHIKQAIVSGYLFGIANFASSLYWLHISMHQHGQMPWLLAALGVVLFAMYLAIYYGLAAGLSYYLLRNALALSFEGALGSSSLATTSSVPISGAQDHHNNVAGSWVRRLTCHPSTLLAPLIWAATITLAELARGYALTGFPWNAIGYAHVDSLLSAWAPVAGVYGVVFVASTLSGLITLMLWQQRWTLRLEAAVAALLVLGLSLMLHYIRWWQPQGDPLSVRLVQTNIDMHEKFDYRQGLLNIYDYFSLAQLPPTDPARPPALVLFPETLIPVFQQHLNPQIWSDIVGMSARSNATYILGAPLDLQDIDGQRRQTNSLIQLDAFTSVSDIMLGHNLPMYHKRHLVPFGEYVPKGFRWFVDLMGVPLGDFDAGRSHQQLMQVEGQQLAPNICYEDLFGEELREQVLPRHDGTAGGNILINVSNLGWFGNTIALGQHLNIARMRSMELARPTLRATNTGMTAAIDADGQVIATLPPYQTGILDVAVQGTTGLTWYTRLGNLPVLLLSVLVLVLAWFRRPTKV